MGRLLYLACVVSLSQENAHDHWSLHAPALEIRGGAQTPSASVPHAGRLFRDRDSYPGGFKGSRHLGVRNVVLHTRYDCMRTRGASPVHSEPRAWLGMFESLFHCVCLHGLFDSASTSTQGFKPPRSAPLGTPLPASTLAVIPTRGDLSALFDTPVGASSSLQLSEISRLLNSIFGPPLSSSEPVCVDARVFTSYLATGKARILQKAMPVSYPDTASCLRAAVAHDAPPEDSSFHRLEQVLA
jgi:hypothetical protein